jgi:hypothetical protein
VEENELWGSIVSPDISDIIGSFQVVPKIEKFIPPKLNCF